jgi:hypothetical protein
VIYLDKSGAEVEGIVVAEMICPAWVVAPGDSLKDLPDICRRIPEKEIRKRFTAAGNEG